MFEALEITRIKEALKAQGDAENRFNNADPELTDAVALEFAAADRRVSAAFREARSLFCLNGLAQATNGGKEC